MAKFKFIRRSNAEILFAERWVPEKGTRVDGVEESLDREGQLIGYHTLDAKGNPFAVYSGDYILPDGDGYRPCSAALFAEQFDGMLPSGRIMPSELFLALDLFGALLEELIQGASARWGQLLEEMYKTPEQALAAYQTFIKYLKSQDVDTTALEESMDSVRFFDPRHN